MSLQRKAYRRGVFRLTSVTVVVRVQWQLIYALQDMLCWSASTLHNSVSVVFTAGRSKAVVLVVFFLLFFFVILWPF